MTEPATTPIAKTAGKIQQSLANAWWVRIMRTVIGVLAVGIAAQSAMLMWRGHLSPTEMWLVGMTGTLGLSALVEAAWPDGQHGLLQFWCLTALGASGLISWAAGGDKWLGILGAVMVGLAFALAVMSSVKGRRIDAA